MLARLRRTQRDRFNEAAGIPRGRLAERQNRARATGFNEAAGIPRGRLGVVRVGRDPATRFNEAAGIPRGRRGFRRQDESRLAGPASMRPRVFPAEDSVCRPEIGRGPRFNEAAGIPRGRQSRKPPSLPRHQGASMRPRVFPAEDPTARDCIRDCAIGFNEAAGIPRGRRCSMWMVVRPRVFPGKAHDRPVASMRPRVFPAEDASAANEASGKQ